MNYKKLIKELVKQNEAIYHDEYISTQVTIEKIRAWQAKVDSLPTDVQAEVYTSIKIYKNN